MRASAESRQPGQAASSRQARKDASARNRSYDRRERVIAARIAREHRGWVVLWGLSIRSYWAFPTDAAVPLGTILCAPDPRELVFAIRQTELAAVSRPLAPVPQPPSPDQPHRGGPCHA